MKIVVDTNIIFSAILNTNGKIGDLLLNSEPNLEFYTVTYLRIEIEKHKSKLIEISGLNTTQLEEAKTLVFSKITFISEEVIPYQFWMESAKIVRDVDMDDIAFVALSKYMENIKLWTGDKKLLKGIQSKGFTMGVSTEELEEIRTKLETR